MLFQAYLYLLLTFLELILDADGVRPRSHRPGFRITARVISGRTSKNPQSRIAAGAKNSYGLSTPCSRDGKYRTLKRENQAPVDQRHKWPLLLSLATGGFILAKIGEAASVSHGSEVPLWPGTGATLALVLLGGRKMLPLIFALTFLSRVTPPGAWGFAGAQVSGALLIALTDSVQAGLGAWVVRRWAPSVETATQPREVIKFVLAGAGPGALLSPLAGVLLLPLLGEPLSDQGGALLAWWLGGTVSVLVVTPLVLAWARPWAASREQKLDLLKMTVLMAFLCWLVFGGWITSRSLGLLFAFWLVPAALWMTRRFDHRGSMSVVFIFACGAIGGTVSGFGPFAIEDRATSRVLLQSFLAVTAFTAMILAADNRAARLAAESLARSEKRYRKLFENSPQAMWVFDSRSLRFLAVNRAAVRGYGYSRREFFALTLEEIRAAGEPARGAGSGVMHERKHRRKDGTLLDVEVSSFELEFDGQPATLMLSIDITERKRTDNRARIFSELGRRLSAARTPKEAGKSILEAADRLFGWDACLFELWQPAAQTVTTVISMDRIQGRRVELPGRTSAPGPLIRRTLREGARLILRQTPHFSAGAVPFGDHSRPSASIMLAPVQAEAAPIAFLSIQSYLPNAYTEQDLQGLQALADHCGAALDRIRAEAELGQSREQMRQITDALPVFIARLDCEERFLFANFACEQWLRVSRGEILGRSIGKVLAPAVAARLKEPLRQVMAGQPQVFEIELEPGQEPRFMEMVFIPATAVGGAPEGFYLLASDISERKESEREILRLNSELERRVAERTAQLEAINRELEAFSYSVSHDLRAPLRSIRGFSEVLLESYAGQLDERGREFLRRSCQSSQHMDRLIDDLLKLSRVTRSELQTRPVNLSRLAEEIIADLRKTEPARNVEVVIAPDLTAQGDERLLRIVLENLLRNAWKFTGKTAAARIEFGVSYGEPREFVVRDNGAGFDMKYAAKLFGVFQRLHTSSEFAGTGIGLATVQRIVNRHGGSARAESAPGQGAAFYFSLPESP